MSSPNKLNFDIAVLNFCTSTVREESMWPDFLIASIQVVAGTSQQFDIRGPYVSSAWSNMTSLSKMVWWMPFSDVCAINLTNKSVCFSSVLRRLLLGWVDCLGWTRHDYSKTSGHCKEYGGWSHDGPSRFINLIILVVHDNWGCEQSEAMDGETMAFCRAQAGTGFMWKWMMTKHNVNWRIMVTFVHWKAQKHYPQRQHHWT